ncbi:MAG TPA: hypothetical protein PK765_06450 [bacterium]|nr:hypothetical protein [bacterium]
MISRNPWVPEVWGHFMTSINRSRGIRVAFHDTLNKQVAPELATPNTRRVAAFLDHHENLTDIGQLPFIGECIHDTHALAEVVSSIKSQAVFSVSEK